MSKVKNESFFTVFGWMLNTMKLEKTDLAVYAIIYGFSQDGESSFEGSLGYLQNFTGAGRSTVIEALGRLEQKGYIVKETTVKNSLTFNKFKADLKKIEQCRTTGTETGLGASGNRTGGSTETGPNKIGDNKGDNIEETIEMPLGGNSGSEAGKGKPKSPNSKAGKGKVKEGVPGAGEKKLTVEPEFPENWKEETKQAVREWLIYKQERKQAYKPKFLDVLIRRCCKYSQEAVIEAIEVAMSSYWSGFFPREKLTSQKPNSLQSNLTVLKNYFIDNGLSTEQSSIDPSLL